MFSICFFSCGNENFFLSYSSFDDIKIRVLFLSSQKFFFSKKCFYFSIFFFAERKFNLASMLNSRTESKRKNLKVIFFLHHHSIWKDGRKTVSFFTNYSRTAHAKKNEENIVKSRISDSWQLRTALFIYFFFENREVIDIK